MKIYDFPFAPNPTKLRVYLREKGLELPRVTVNLVHGEQNRPEFLAKNPNGALPVLELDDGRCITESLAILEYLEELHPEPPMIGRDPVERALVRSFERFVDLNVLIRLARIVHNSASPLPGFQGVPEIAAAERSRLPKVLRIVDERIGKGPFALGEKPTIADCTLYAGLRFAETAGGLEVPAEHPNLRRWYRDFSKRPSTQL